MWSDKLYKWLYKELKKPSFFDFPEDVELTKKWIYFVNQKEWVRTLNSVIWPEHFESKHIKYGKRCILKWELHPIRTTILTQYFDRQF